MDDLPAERAPTAAAAVKEKTEPEIKKYFDVVGTGMHMYGGHGRLAGKSVPYFLYACKVPGCWRGTLKPIKQCAQATGQLFIHLNDCQPDLCRRLRSESKHSPVCIDADGMEYSLYSFEELLPHHARYVQKCFRGLDHFDETRADNGLVEYVQGYNPRASLPCAKTCLQLLEVRRTPFYSCTPPAHTP